MVSGGKMPDGTPFIAIGANEPEANRFTVHTECEACGEMHYFDFWAMFRGEWITCEHCGHRTRAKRRRYVGDDIQEYDYDADRWVDVEEDE